MYLLKRSASAKGAASVTLVIAAANSRPASNQLPRAARSAVPASAASTSTPYCPFPKLVQMLLVAKTESARTQPERPHPAKPKRIAQAISQASVTILVAANSARAVRKLDGHANSAPVTYAHGGYAPSTGPRSGSSVAF